METINGCCSGCDSQQLDHTKETCPKCYKDGISVDRVTVEHLVKDKYRDDVDEDKYKICTDEDCDVVYYRSDSEKKFTRDQIRVPIWYKKDADPKYACYCSEITEQQVIDAVINHNAKTVKEVNEITGAMSNANCKVKNPLGVCCHKIIQEVIDKV